MQDRLKKLERMVSLQNAQSLSGRMKDLENALEGLKQEIKTLNDSLSLVTMTVYKDHEERELQTK